MTVYCNISECVFNKELEEPHQRMYGRGYVPIGNTGQYKGTCSRGAITVKSGTVHTNQTKYVIPECTYFSEDVSLLEAIQKSEVESSCNEKRCLHFDSDSSCTLTPHVYVNWQTVNNLGKVTKYPKCDSFSNRRIAGHIDWSKSGIR